MKQLTILGLGLHLLAAMPAIAQVITCELKSCAALAGGSTSAGGRFTMTATVGQAEATRTISGGKFNLEPGFLSSIIVQQTEGAPVLKIRIAAGRAILSWDKTAAGFTLEQTSAVASGSWTAVPVEVLDTDSEHTVTVPASGEIMCYRLRKP